MTVGLPLYQIATRILSLFYGTLLARRVRMGKEDANRLNERRAKKLPPRPVGRIVWLHGASVGECKLLLELGKQLQAEVPDVHLLFTSQTRTSADLVAKNLPPRSIHQMAPVDTPGNAKRFVFHWQPALGVIAEGEIWPNLVLAAKKNGARLALVNARMTEKSLTGWARWRCTAQKVFGTFNVVLAADQKTANGLNKFMGPVATSPGNLKAALPPPPPTELPAFATLREAAKGRLIYLAASTHSGEEELFLDALGDTNDLRIIAPRHPERAEAILKMITDRGLTCAQWSKKDAPGQDTDVVLADTIGEMGNWFRFANSVYLGGGHTPNVGGHNPIEPVMLGKPVVTGPDVYNFKDMITSLADHDLIRIVTTSEELGQTLREMPTPSETQVSELRETANAPMQATLDALLPLLEVPL